MVPINRPSNKRKLAGVFIVLVLALVILFPRPVYAFPGEALAAAVWKFVAEGIRDIAKSAWKVTKDVAYKNALITLTTKVAQDVASYAATGGRGQKPLFLTNPGQYLEDVGNAAAGDYVDTLSTTLFGQSVCTFDLTQRINIDRFVRNAIIAGTPNFCGEKAYTSTAVGKKAWPLFAILSQFSDFMGEDYSIKEPYKTAWAKFVDQNIEVDDSSFLSALIDSMESAQVEGKGVLDTAPADGQAIETKLLSDLGATNNPSEEQAATVLLKLRQDEGYLDVLQKSLLKYTNDNCDGNSKIASFAQEKFSNTDKQWKACQIFRTFFIYEYVNIKSEINTQIASCGLAGEDKSRQARCNLSQIGHNLDPRRVKPSNISAMFNSRESALGMLLTGIRDAQNINAKKRAGEEFAQTASTFVGVRSPVTGELKTPKEAVQSFIGSVQQRADKAESTYTGSSIADLFFRTFTRTLVNKLIQQTFVRGLNPKTNSSIPKTFEDLIGQSAVPAIVSSLEVPTIEASGKIDMLDEFTTCPNFEPARTVNNCVMDNNFRDAVEEEMTVDEAIKKGKLHGNRLFGFMSSGGSSGGGNLVEPISPQIGYPASAMKKLRLARIIPLGWEIAADEIYRSGEAATLQQVVDGFNTEGGRFKGLVDPNWILKAPESFCRAEVYGPFLEAQNTKERQKICADLQSCVVEDPSSGKCLSYGYCTREKTVWSFPNEVKSCNADNASCGSFRGADGKAYGYKRDSLYDSHAFCAADAAGCKSYIYGSGADASTKYFSDQAEKCRLEDSTTNKYVKKDAGGNIVSTVYLKDAPSCTAEQVGCDGFAPLKGGESISAKTPSSCPASCVGLQSFIELNPKTGESAGMESFIPSTARQCTEEEVGCEEYTNLDEVARGGEGREYYSYTRECEKPVQGSATQATYFTWEGADTLGLRLKSWTLVSSSLGFANACEPSSGNLDCKEFIDINGTVTSSLLSKAIIVSNECLPFRKTDGGSRVDLLKKESRQCRLESVGCRVYKGPAAGNVERIFKFDFEDGTAPAGWGSAQLGVEPANSNRFIKREGFVSYSLGKDLKKNASYVLKFYARGEDAAENSSLLVVFGQGIENRVLEDLTNDWKQFNVNITPANDIQNASFTIYLKPDTNLHKFLDIDNIELTGSESRHTLVKGSWNNSVCEADAQILDASKHYYDFSGCSAYRSQNTGTQVNATTFSVGECTPKTIGCDSFTQATGVKSGQIVNVVNRPEFRGSESFAGCTKLKSGSDDVALIIKPKDESDFTKGLIGQCDVAQAGCESFTDEFGSKTVFNKSKTGVDTCEKDQASCTALNAEGGPYYEKLLTIPKPGDCAGENASAGCVKFDYSAYIDGAPKNASLVSKVDRDRQCSEWLYPKSVAVAYDSNIKKDRQVVFSLDRCSKADDKDPSKCETATTTPVKKIDKDYYITQAGSGSGRKDFSGYSIYGQYPVETLVQKWSGRNKYYQLESPAEAPKSIEISPSCRSYPESDSPFNSAKIQQGELVIDSNYRQANYFEPNQGEDNQCSYRKVSYDQYDRITKYYDADKAYGTKVCIGPDIQGTDIEGKSCEYDADCVLIKPTANDTGKRGTCQFAKKVSTHYGWRGYCLERDLSKPIVGTDQYACSTWYPIDLIRGEQDIYSSHPEAGFTSNAYYCLQADSNKDKFLSKWRWYYANPLSENPIKTDSGDDNVGIFIFAKGTGNTDFKRVEVLPESQVSPESIVAVSFNTMGDNPEDEWPEGITMTYDKVNRGVVQEVVTKPKAEEKDRRKANYKFDVFNNEANNTVEWRVYPVAQDGEVPDGIKARVTDIGSYTDGTGGSCGRATDNNPADFNCIWASLVFSKKPDNTTDKLIEIKMGGNDDKGDDENVTYKVIGLTSPACQYIAKETSAYTDKLLNTKESHTVTELGYTRDTPIAKKNGGAGFGQMLLESAPKTLFYMSRDGSLGSPFSCTGECISTPSSLWKTSILKSLGSDLNKARLKIQEVFANMEKVWHWENQQYIEKPEERRSITNLGESPIISPAVLKANDPLSKNKFCVGSETGDCDSSIKGTFAVNGDGTTGIKQVTKGDVVSISFFAYNQNGEQMPIRKISIDWEGDGTYDDISEGYYRNRKEKCRPPSDDPEKYNWGDSPLACEEVPWRFGHVYDPTKNNATIKVIVEDNWGKGKEVETTRTIEFTK